ncbi:MAG TPA: DUF1552 domain-containing protein [Terriglobia bacterium]|nr:DUF1552 domain-containing protein [Terriglobia bacterium]
MFIEKKYLSRRTFLRGAGVTVALPFLEAMLPAQTPVSALAAPKTRFAGIFFPHGMAPGHWVPKTEGASLELPFIMEPLRPVLDQSVILSGLHARSAEPPTGVTGSDHFVAAAYLSAVKPKKTTGADINAGITIDQIIANKIGQDTLLPSLQLAVEDPGASSSCGEGYSCAYTNSISWSSPNQPLPMELNPQSVFERLFGDGSDPEERAARRRQQGSILDIVSESLGRIRTNVGAADRTRLDQYAEDIREIERRLEIARKASAQAPAMSVPVGVPESFDEHIKLQYDLIALAFQSDVTRVATVLGARDLTNRNYPASGTNTGFHAGSHHAESPQKIADYAKINRYHVQMLVYFLEKLKGIPDGDGNLLDHSLVLYGTNMGNSNQHQHYDVPHILAGGASGKLKGGRHLAYPTKTVPTGNLLLSVLDMYGIQESQFGDSTGRLEKL